MEVLERIKRLVELQRVSFTLKAEDELDADGLTHEMVFEAIRSAAAIDKVIRSRRRRGEKLYVIKRTSHEGIAIYTKGRIAPGTDGDPAFYILISSKCSTDG
jgi:hypothetical protein